MILEFVLAWTYNTNRVCVSSSKLCERYMISFILYQNMTILGFFYILCKIFCSSWITLVLDSFISHINFSIQFCGPRQESHVWVIPQLFFHYIFEFDKDRFLLRLLIFLSFGYRRSNAFAIWSVNFTIKRNMISRIGFI